MTRWRKRFWCAVLGHRWTMWSMFGGDRLQFRWCRRCDEPQIHDTQERQRRAHIARLASGDVDRPSAPGV